MVEQVNIEFLLFLVIIYKYFLSFYYGVKLINSFCDVLIFMRYPFACFLNLLRSFQTIGIACNSTHLNFFSGQLRSSFLTSLQFHISRPNVFIITKIKSLKMKVNKKFIFH